MPSRAGRGPVQPLPRPGCRTSEALRTLGGRVGCLCLPSCRERDARVMVCGLGRLRWGKAEWGGVGCAGLPTVFSGQALPQGVIGTKLWRAGGAGVLQAVRAAGAEVLGQPGCIPPPGALAAVPAVEQCDPRVCVCVCVCVCGCRAALRKQMWGGGARQTRDRAAAVWGRAGGGRE